MQLPNRARPALAALAATLLMLPALAPAAPASAPAPEFSLPARSGGDVSLSSLRGQVVLVNFWATWCGPCRKEMPLLEQIYQRYKGLGFTLLAVNVEEDSGGADQWLRDTPVSFPVLFDRDNRVSKLYQVTAMPSTVIIDRKGQVRFIHYGYTPGTENEYQDQVRSLIREKS
ncbi:MAG: TlpA family protein disulfide reductase [Gammaproteobacteria bacterium]|nr:TlpA family protein disulfide reductase [Gammaproteobacteria bacterium]